MAHKRYRFKGFARVTEQDVLNKLDSILWLLDHPTPELAQALFGHEETPLENLPLAVYA